MIEDHVLRGIAHGMAQGTMSELQGGKFKDGFWSGAVGHWAGVVAGKYMIEGNDFDAVAARTSVAAMAGGIAASAGGGKFANGAVTAAMVHLFNAEWFAPPPPRPFEPPRVFESNGELLVKGNGITLAEDSASYSVDVRKLGPAGTVKLKVDTDGTVSLGVSIKKEFGLLSADSAVFVGTNGVVTTQVDVCGATYCGRRQTSFDFVNLIKSIVPSVTYAAHGIFYQRYYNSRF